jgi:hypothetical protein
MKGTDNQQSVSLPESLHRQFARLERRLWKVETVLAACFALSGLIISFLALFVSDRFWETPIWLRVALASSGWACLALALLLWLKMWVFRRRDEKALAILVQRQYRRLGDRLLGIVELADERRRPTQFSPELYRAAIAQVAGEAAQFDFRQAVNPAPARRLGAALAALFFLALIPLWLSGPATLNAFKRWAAPTAGVARFTLVSLEGLPTERVVAHGESFQMSCQVQYRSSWKPSRAVFQFERQPGITGVWNDGQLHARVPAQMQNGFLRIRLGDAQARVKIIPTHRPSLKELSAVIQLPDYLQHPSSTENAEHGSLRVIEGSRVSFRGTTSRALAAAQLQESDQTPQTLSVVNESFSTEPLDLDGIRELSFSWRDHHGLESGAPWRMQIQGQKDAPPLPDLQGMPKDVAILESEVLDIIAVARDDFGVRELGLDWQRMRGWDEENTAAPEEFKVETETPHEKRFEQTFRFSPTLLLIPPDSVVQLRGFATDYFPGREPSYTTVYRIHVLGNETHAELVRQNLESLLTRLEEVTRLEEKIAAQTRDLQNLPEDALKSDETTGQIQETEQEQTQNAANLEELAREGSMVLREAIRNPTFPEETLRDWIQNMQQMRQLAEQDMREASEALKAAQRNDESRAEELAGALEKQEDILQALEELQRRVNQGLDQLQALTLAQRLRKIALDEKGIAARIQKIVPEVIGLLPRELPERFRKIQANLSGEQEAAQQETKVLEGEIGRFFERTQKENYGQVNQEMAASRVGEELDRVRGMIQENISMEAIRNLGQWSGQLTAWAELLEPPSDSGGGGGGGEGGNPDDTLMKQLMALLRVRDREINLRQRTGILDKQRADETVYREAARALSASQEQIRGQVAQIQSENMIPAFEFPLQDIIDSMQDVEELLDKPQTDRETDMAQTQAIEQLSDIINLINEQQQRSSSSSSSASLTAEEMAFLMEMMALQPNPALGMGMNPQGGGSLAGGSTERPATPMPGAHQGQAEESRAVNRAGGSTANFPTEFREALENYFKAIEQLELK